jgi:N utilization substance protein B
VSVAAEGVAPRNRAPANRPGAKPGDAKRGGTNKGGANRARSLARRLTLQALYQLQINERPWQDTHQEYAADPEAERVDREYFRALLMAIAPNREPLDRVLARFSEIPPQELDPIEHAALWLGLHELQGEPELPYRVVLSEAVQLTKQFGATDGHKFVNAVLDRAAREMRPHEYGQSAAPLA